MFARWAYDAGYRQGVADTLERLRPSQEKLRQATEEAKVTIAEHDALMADVRARRDRARGVLEKGTGNTAEP